MKDFEVHEIGTAQELKLCRQLVNDMQQLCEQYGEGIFHITILNTHRQLLTLYSQQLEKERYG